MPRTAMPPIASCEPDLKTAVELVTRLMAVPGKSGEEDLVQELVVDTLRAAGAPAGAILRDTAHLRSPLGGRVGNLIFKLPGTLRMPRRMLMAHLDTVPLCVGCEPVRKGKQIRSANKATGLGADDRAGVAVVLTAAIEILRRKLPHPPLTFFWPVQEEVGLHGAQFADLKLLGNPRLVFNWDGGAPDRVVTGATGAYRITIDITGLASHAGGAPEQGISAITIASLAIANLHRQGWLGDVRKGRLRGTSNVGMIEGGKATNVVTDAVRVQAECRSHDGRFRKLIGQTIVEAFRQAAKEVKNVAGKTGRISATMPLGYEAFRLPDDAPAVLAAQEAVRAIGSEPQLDISNGGLDANWLSARGLPTVSLGCGQNEIHTVNEFLHIPDFERACRIAMQLATGAV